MALRRALRVIDNRSADSSTGPCKAISRRFVVAAVIAIPIACVFYSRLSWPSSIRRLATDIESERAQEITEGLAAYTATVLATESTSDAIASALGLLADSDGAESFVRTFAYMSGPAYGLLLDASAPGWTRRIRGTDDLAMLLMNATALRLWTFKAAPGWIVREGARQGDYEVVRQQP